jgi:glycosyltransferase involved in cell wall biosynthesis
VVDGGSRDETASVLGEYREDIDILISEPDRGIYDAMNKGLRVATGDWYVMMNAGDVFAGPNSISENMLAILASGAVWGGGGSCIRFPDGSERVYFSDSESGVFHQQSVFLRRSLHDFYGYFLTSSASKAWDYFFFNLVKQERFFATGVVVAICDGTGVSSSVSNYLQVQAMAFIFGNQGRMTTGLKLLLYPAYRLLRSPLAALKQLGSRN